VLVFVFDIEKYRSFLKEAVVAYLKILLRIRILDRSVSVMTRLQARRPG